MKWQRNYLVKFLKWYRIIIQFTIHIISDYILKLHYITINF